MNKDSKNNKIQNEELENINGGYKQCQFQDFVTIYLFGDEAVPETCPYCGSKINWHRIDPREFWKDRKDQSIGEGRCAQHKIELRWKE